MTQRLNLNIPAPVGIPHNTEQGYSGGWRHDQN